MAISTAFSFSLTLSPSISLLSSFKPNTLPSRNNLLFPNSPISAPITITNAKNKHKESISAVTVESDVDNDDYDEDEDEVEDGDEEFLAFEDMRKWELNKPAGFGEGKVYDTTTEEKLLEEMEKERMEQIASEKKKEKSSLSKKQEQRSQKDVFPSGCSVRLGNLPKKKNIHRDLQTAFKGFNGIVKINPAVMGNWKTRDPICKGFAFVELVSEEASIRFVNTYSMQDILFGKVKKQISFDIINPGKLVNGTQTLAQPNFMNSRYEKQEKISVPIVNETDKESALVMNGASAPLSDSEERETDIEHLNLPPSSGNENERHANELGSKSSDKTELPFQKQKKQIASKKKVVKKKSIKTANLSSPSSMMRLKIKERAVLTGVFTRYGGKKCFNQISS